MAPLAPPDPPAPAGGRIPTLPAHRTANGATWRPSGDWTLDTLEAAAATLGAAAESVQGTDALVLDLARLDRLDTAGALVLAEAAVRTGARTVRLVGGRDEHRALVEVVRACVEPGTPAPRRPRWDAALRPLGRLGAAIVEAFAEFGRQLDFVGRLLAALPPLIRRPRELPLVPFVAHVERAGVDAAPLVGLLSLMIGGVLAFLGADMLSRFGASIFTVNLVSFGFLREFGVLLAAILVAGRSASAFAAEIGSMKAREEIDAMRVLGLDPLARLVVPRIAALVVALPLLVVVADLLGLLGGAIVSAVALDIAPELFLERLRETTELRHAAAGLVKAPVFALLIGVIGCFQGLQVEGDAVSVGRRTTRAVVQAIFAVILADAFFAVLLLEIGL
ncbi:MAG: MlaE family lipid ABC transporter permease subunit [Acidobacteriota bacterium]